MQFLILVLQCTLAQHQIAQHRSVDNHTSRRRARAIARASSLARFPSVHRTVDRAGRRTGRVWWTVRKGLFHASLVALCRSSQSGHYDDRRTQEILKADIELQAGIVNAKVRVDDPI